MKLADFRARIDAIDSEIQRLLNERAAQVIEVGHHKRAVDGESAVFVRPDREAQILRSVAERNGVGPMPTQRMVHLFKEIISACLTLEQPLTIGYLGPEGTFTQAAALKRFGESASVRSLATINEVFREVEACSIDYGVVPVENSTEGMVNQTLDCLLKSTLHICGEVELAIHHHLLCRASTKRDQIKRLFSHQQSFAQCRGWLDAQMPGIERIVVSSNGEAARMVADLHDAAAIAGDLAAKRYELMALVSNIEDELNNTTRFLILGRHEVAPSGNDKTSILVSTRNEPGALYRLLEPFHRLQLNLTRLETRPARTGNWSYVFFIDLDGHVSEPRVQNALEEIRRIALEVRVLGAYPKASL